MSASESETNSVENRRQKLKIEKTPEADGFVTRWRDSITNYTLEEGLRLLDWLYAHHEWLRGKDNLQAESLLRDFRIEIQQNPVKPFQESDEGMRTCHRDHEASTRKV